MIWATAATNMVTTKMSLVYAVKKSMKVHSSTSHLPVGSAALGVVTRGASLVGELDVVQIAFAIADHVLGELVAFEQLLRAHRAAADECAISH